MINVLLTAKNGGEDIFNGLRAYPELSVKLTDTHQTQVQGFCADVIVSDVLTETEKPLILILDSEEISKSAFKVDDFVKTPVCIAELAARIMRLIAPVTRKTEQKVFKMGRLTVDLENAAVFFDSTQIHLTLFEYKLLCLLVQKQGAIVSYSEILHSLWESPIGNEMLSIRVFVNAIRRKLAIAGAMEDIIRTHAGKGYSLE